LFELISYIKPHGIVKYHCWEFNRGINPTWVCWLEWSFVYTLSKSYKQLLSIYGSLILKLLDFLCITLHVFQQFKFLSNWKWTTFHLSSQHLAYFWIAKHHFLLIELPPIAALYKK
jgi:hypothetical protein